MSDVKWSEWIEWSGGECQVDPLLEYEVKLRCGDVLSGKALYQWRWSHYMVPTDIIAYRYKIEEPESDMHPDLEWLAINVRKWPADCRFMTVINGTYGKFYLGLSFNDHSGYEPSFDHKQWLQARKDLGLDQPEVTEAEEEEWQRMDKEQSRQQYSAYYKDVRHIEYIDVYRTVDLFGCEKHGHPISHAAKKLLLSGSRTGGKDVEEDVREAIDSLYRWLEMREEDKRAL